jgi:hypothetical protein
MLIPSCSVARARARRRSNQFTTTVISVSSPHRLDPIEAIR